jgi:hypothetical protein
MAIRPASCALILGTILTSPARPDATESVVTIYCTSQTGSSQGTGFILGSNNYVVTAYHVIERAKTVSVRDFKFEELAGVRVAYIDPEHDLAVLKVTGATSLHGLDASSSPPTDTIPVHVVGSPRGLPSQVLFGHLTSKGAVSSMKISAADGRPIFAKDINIFPTDVTVYGGMSGAPVLDAGDGVIGILSGSYDEGRGIGWAIPINYVIDLMKETSRNWGFSAVPTWPTLSLMAPAWVSLKRSYTREFTPEHVAQLEVLETAVREMHGQWAGTANTKTDTFVMPGKCQNNTHVDFQLHIDDIDQERAVITVWWTYASTQAAVSIPAPELAGVPLTSAVEQAAACNEAVFADRAISSGNMNLKASASMKADLSRGPNDNQMFNLKSNITDCDGTLCTAAVLGSNENVDSIPLERISSGKLRFGNLLLANKP